MTGNAIVEKLRVALSGPVDSECKVVYILAESRKLLETYPPDPVLFTLKLYCHWALHVDLSHQKTTLPFLERVDKYVAGYLVGNQDITEDYRMLRELVLLDTFRQQFKQFLQHYDLPTVICDEDPRWHEFLKHYAGVIEDGSLSCKTEAPSLKLIDEVVFTKGRALETSQSFYLPFALAWTIVLRDGKNLTFEVKASAPDGNEMISNVITLH